MNLRPVCCANDEQLLLFARASAILQMKIQRSREEECVCVGGRGEGQQQQQQQQQQHRGRLREMGADRDQDTHQLDEKFRLDASTALMLPLHALCQQRVNLKERGTWRTK